MNDVRKYIKIIEEYERLDEISRKDAISTIERFSYNIAPHIAKIWYYPNHTAVNHWKAEVVNFINSIIKRSRKVKIKRMDIYKHLSMDVLSIQIRRKIILELHTELGKVLIDERDMYRDFEYFFNELSSIIAENNEIDYNVLNELLQDT